MQTAPPLSIILVKPQLGENIGATARVMRNFGHTDLRLVSPRDGWPNPHALPLSAGAFDAGVSVSVFDRTEDALHSLHYVFATTARPRGLEKPVYSLEAAYEKGKADHCGLLFGPENSGLDNSDVSLCDGIITYPVDSEFKSINLAQAVGLASYGWADRTNGIEQAFASSPPAEKQDLMHLFNHLETELDSAGFFFPGDKRTLMMNNLKNAIARAEWSAQEVQTFRGVIKALAKGRGQQGKGD